MRRCAKLRMWRLLSRSFSASPKSSTIELGLAATIVFAEPHKGVDAHKSSMPRALDAVVLVNEVNLGISSLDENVRAARNIVLSVPDNPAFQVTYGSKWSDLEG